MTGPYTRVTYHGKTMNARTKAMVQQAEDYLGYELTILQGSYHKGATAHSRRQRRDALRAEPLGTS